VRLWVLGVLAFSGCLAVTGLVQGNPGSAAFFGLLTTIGLALAATRETRRRRQLEALQSPGALRTLMLKWSAVAGVLFLIALVLFVSAGIVPASQREPLIVFGSLSTFMAALMTFFLVIAFRRTDGGKEVDRPSPERDE